MTADPGVATGLGTWDSGGFGIGDRGMGNYVPVPTWIGYVAQVMDPDLRPRGKHSWMNACELPDPETSPAPQSRVPSPVVGAVRAAARQGHRRRE
jgi:hypothetical protein